MRKKFILITAFLLMLCGCAVGRADNAGTGQQLFLVPRISHRRSRDYCIRDTAVFSDIERMIS